MSDHCNQCADWLDFPRDDFSDMSPGDTALFLCEGCGATRVDHHGYCVEMSCGGDYHAWDEATHGVRHHAIHGPRLMCGCLHGAPTCTRPRLHTRAQRGPGSRVYAT